MQLESFATFRKSRIIHRHAFDLEIAGHLRGKLLRRITVYGTVPGVVMIIRQSDWPKTAAEEKKQVNKTSDNRKTGLAARFMRNILRSFIGSVYFCTRCADNSSTAPSVSVGEKRFRFPPVRPNLRKVAPSFYLSAILAQLSFSVTVRLKTGLPGAESRSMQK